MIQFCRIVRMSFQLTEQTESDVMLPPEGLLPGAANETDDITRTWLTERPRAKAQT